MVRPIKSLTGLEDKLIGRHIHMDCDRFVRNPTEGDGRWTPRRHQRGEIRYAPAKENVRSPPVGIKTPDPTVDTTEKPCLFCRIILPPRIEDIDKEVGLEEGIAATP